MARTVAVVPHTHWDREWYSSFQAFRLRLVDLLDEFLPRLEADPGYARFMLDGQMAVVDDYLEVRPEAEARLKRLAASGRLSVGPWYVLMDEFLVSGETIVRDLQMGLERAAGFGGAMPVGYLPDMFGHVAQMPQLLRLAGIGHAVVWRGVPSAIDRSAFWWSAPDGSTVRAEYLRVGYGNGASVPDDAKALVARIRAHERELGELLSDDAPLIWMNGTDHEVPQPWLGRVVAEANELQDDYRLVITSLPEVLGDAPIDGLPSWRGELRSGARANLLMGVASNRVDVKQAAARAERALERRAEPLSALFLPPDRWPEALLRVAWREVVRNAAHDTVCACSIDTVGAAALHRYAEATDVADGLARRALRALARSLSDAGAVVVNASARPRSGLVELTLPGADPVGDDLQLLATEPGGVEDHAMTGHELNPFVGDLANRAARHRIGISDVDLDDDDLDDDGVAATLHIGGTVEATTGARMAELFARAGALGNSSLSVRVVRRPWRRVLARVEDVAGFGWKRWSADPLGIAPVRAHDDGVLDNGLVRVAVDPADGTFSIGELTGLGRLVDRLDAGDTYNYSPPANDEVVDHPAAVAVAVEEAGPLRARLTVTRTYNWQERMVDVDTRVELRAGEALVRVETSFVNPVGDHRLRAHFPLPSSATTSRAECAFTVVERGLTAEGGPHEVGLPTFPSRRFVSAGGLTLVHEGLLEYELVDEGRELALTLLRATGRISGGLDMTYRRCAAGPPNSAPAAQMVGPVGGRFALHVGDADPYALADHAFVPLEVVHAAGGGDRPPSGSALSVEGAQVSAVVRRADALEVRVFNPTDDETTVTIAGRAGWLVDLRGRPLEPFEGSFALGPHGIGTARVVGCP